MELSYPWAGTVTGDASLAPYDDDEWSDLWCYMFVAYRNAAGVIRGVDDEYEASGATTPVTISTGAAIVDGKVHRNTANVQFVIAAPTANPRIDRIVLRKSWTNQIVRLTLISGVEAAIPTPPSVTQIDGTTWDVRLWQVFIDTGGNITLTPEFDYASAAIEPELIQQGRLSLLYNIPIPSGDVTSETPSNTDIVDDEVDFASALEWQTGQAVQVSGNTADLTTGTIYYVSEQSAGANTSYSLHETFLDAINDANTINLTGNVQPETLYPAKIYYVKYNGDQIDVPINDYTRVRKLIHNRNSEGPNIDIIGWDASKLYDIWIYESADEQPTLESLAWNNSGAGTSARTTDIAEYHGRYIKSGDSTRLYLGTIMTTAVAGQVLDKLRLRTLWNYYNRVSFKDLGVDDTNSWLINTAVYTAFNAGNVNWKHEFIIGVDEYEMVASLIVNLSQQTPRVAIALDGIVFDASKSTASYESDAANTHSITAKFAAHVGVGYHYLQCIHRNSAAGNSTYFGDGGGTTEQSGWVVEGWK